MNVIHSNQRRGIYKPNTNQTQTTIYCSNWPKINCVISITVFYTAKGGSYRLIPTVTNLKNVVLGTSGCKDMLPVAKVVLYSINNNKKYMV